jgi:hypothetical protein
VNQTVLLVRLQECRTWKELGRTAPTHRIPKLLIEFRLAMIALTQESPMSGLGVLLWEL